jgi:hypothetical protein
MAAIVMMFRHQDPPDPLKDFAENQAKSQGLYMPMQTAIDYLNVVPPNGTSGLSLDGLVFQNGSKFLCISVGRGTPLVAPVTMNNAITYLPNTCLNGKINCFSFNIVADSFLCLVQTDSSGLTTIWTMTSDSTGSTVTQVCLAVTDSGSVVALPPPSKTIPDSSGNMQPVDPKVYAKLLKQQQWAFNCTSKGGSVTVSGTKYIEGATFQIQSNYSQAYLNIDKQSLKATMGSGAQDWFCSLQSVGPSKFSYSANPWIIFTTSRDQMIVPQMSSPGSQPLVWSITPPLPSGLKLLNDGANGGSISISTGMTAVQTPSTIYSVTASILINHQTYSQQCQVTIEVDTPPSGLLSNTAPAESPTGSSIQPGHVASNPVPPPPIPPIVKNPLEPLFDFTQESTAFGSHPVTLMVLNFLKSRIDGSWWRSNLPYKTTFFPGFVQTAPDLSSVVSWDYNTYWKALVTKAIYNTVPRCQVNFFFFSLP